MRKMRILGGSLQNLPQDMPGTIVEWSCCQPGLWSRSQGVGVCEISNYGVGVEVGVGVGVGVGISDKLGVEVGVGIFQISLVGV